MKIMDLLLGIGAIGLSITFPMFYILWGYSLSDPSLIKYFDMNMYLMLGFLGLCGVTGLYFRMDADLVKGKIVK